MSRSYAPGVRVEIRDAEWRIKCVDRTSDGGELLTCEGLSELVRGREATFLSKIEPSIRVLAPAATVLIAHRKQHRPHPRPQHRRHHLQNLNQYNPVHRPDGAHHRLRSTVL